MIYTYSQINLLQEPHNYMYAPFQGEAFIRSYLASRMASIHNYDYEKSESEDADDMLMALGLPALGNFISASSIDGGERFRELLDGANSKILKKGKIDRGNCRELAKTLERLSMAEPVSTLDLSQALIAAELVGNDDANTRIWLDRLVQRFEVTKRLYKIYPPGFRNGEGSHISVRLYWLFALALCLFYARTNEIKYLSTFLKVCDLLSSLPKNLLQGCIPEYGLLAVLVAEIVFVQLLAEQKGISFGP